MANVLAELTMAVHFAVLAFIVLGGFLAWRWPWMSLVHLPFALWGVGIATLGFRCPLTELEDHLRGSGTEEGFIERYLDGVLYPGEHLVLTRVIAATLVLTAYTGAIILWRRRARAPSSRRWSAPGTGAPPGSGRPRCC